MVRKMIAAVIVTMVAISFAYADEFRAIIIEVDGDKLTYQKNKNGKKDGDAVTINVAKDAIIAHPRVNRAALKIEAGDRIKGGLKHEMFDVCAEDFVIALITTDVGGNATQILVIGEVKKPGL